MAVHEIESYVMMLVRKSVSSARCVMPASSYTGHCGLRPVCSLLAAFDSRSRQQFSVICCSCAGALTWQLRECYSSICIGLSCFCSHTMLGGSVPVCNRKRVEYSLSSEQDQTLDIIVLSSDMFSDCRRMCSEPIIDCWPQVFVAARLHVGSLTALIHDCPLSKAVSKHMTVMSGHLVK